MGSVGACRQCAIKSFKDEEDGKGKLVMSCMEPVRDGARISISDSEAVEFRAGVIEWLMTNHPHDCAICDEGGSCHLQDLRSEEHTSELQSIMRTSYAVFFLKKKKIN